MIFFSENISFNAIFISLTMYSFFLVLKWMRYFDKHIASVYFALKRVIPFVCLFFSNDSISVSEIYQATICFISEVSGLKYEAAIYFKFFRQYYW